MYNDLSLIIALTAGLVSFLSPCVLPLIPGFLSYLAGTSVDEAKKHRKEVFLNSVFFVLGFSVIFALLGVALNTLLSQIAYSAQLWMSRIGGLIIIFFGLYLTGFIKLKFLQQEHKFKVTKKFKSKYITSFVFGSAFAAGWTPCVGAVLGTIFGLAVTQPGSAFILLLVYALGLGIPFLLIGLFTAQGATFIRKFAKYAQPINIIFGILLIFLGILVFTQRLIQLANFDLLQKILHP